MGREQERGRQDILVNGMSMVVDDDGQAEGSYFEGGHGDGKEQGSARVHPVVKLDTEKTIINPSAISSCTIIHQGELVGLLNSLPSSRASCDVEHVVAGTGGPDDDTTTTTTTFRSRAQPYPISKLVPVRPCFILVHSTPIS